MLSHASPKQTWVNTWCVSVIVFFFFFSFIWNHAWNQCMRKWPLLLAAYLCSLLQMPLREVQQMLNSTEGNFHQLVALLNCRSLNKVTMATCLSQSTSPWQKMCFRWKTCASCFYLSLCFCLCLLGLYWLSERPVLWWDGGIALSLAVFIPFCSGFHSHPLLPPWSLEELFQVTWTVPADFYSNL